MPKDREMSVKLSYLPKGKVIVMNYLLQKFRENGISLLKPFPQSQSA